MEQPTIRLPAVRLEFPLYLQVYGHARYCGFSCVRVLKSINNSAPVESVTKEARKATRV